jgi:hypothetical protein
MIINADDHVYAGEDNLVIGTDYGHTDASSEVDSIDIFRANPPLATRSRKKYLRTIRACSIKSKVRRRRLPSIRERT